MVRPSHYIQWGKKGYWSFFGGYKPHHFDYKIAPTFENLLIITM